MFLLSNKLDLNQKLVLLYFVLWYFLIWGHPEVLGHPKHAAPEGVK